VFIYSSRGKWVFPPLLWSFPPTTTFTSFPLLVAVRVPLFLPSLASLFIYSSVRGCPPPPFGAQGALPSLLHVFFVVVAYYSVFFFSFFPGCGSVCPWGCADLAQGCLWEYHMLLSSPCGLRLPKRSGCCHQAAWEPSWFLHLTWSGDAMRRLRVWRSQSFASSRWFFL
jgi:hypothetical protein